MDPDGRTPKSLKITDDKYMYAPDTVGGQFFNNVFSLLPMGGSSLNLISKAAGVKEIPASISQDSLTYALDVFGNLDKITTALDISSDIVDGLSTFFSIAGNIISIITSLKDFTIGKKELELDQSIYDTAFCYGKMITGKSHEEVALKYNVAKAAFGKLLHSKNYGIKKEGERLIIAAKTGLPKDTQKVLNAKSTKY